MSLSIINSMFLENNSFICLSKLVHQLAHADDNTKFDRIHFGLMWPVALAQDDFPLFFSIVFGLIRRWH
jgi:hypothetical protein